MPLEVERTDDGLIKVTLPSSTTVLTLKEAERLAFQIETELMDISLGEFPYGKRYKETFYRIA